MPAFHSSVGVLGSVFVLRVFSLLLILSCSGAYSIELGGYCLAGGFNTKVLPLSRYASTQALSLASAAVGATCMAFYNFPGMCRMHPVSGGTNSSTTIFETRPDYW